MHLALALLLAVSTPALAQEPPAGTPSEVDMARAKELFENGQMLSDEGHYEDAIVAWEESYRLSGYPDLLWNIAGAHEKLGSYKKALEVLNRYRAYAPATEREVLDRRLKALEERIAATPATTPPATTPVTTTTTTTTTPTVTTTLPVEPVLPPEKASSPLPFVFLGLGAAGLGFGAVEGFQAMGALGKVKELCQEEDGGYLCAEDAQPAVDKHGRTSTLSAVGVGAGAVLATLGVVTITARF